MICIDNAFTPYFECGFFVKSSSCGKVALGLPHRNKGDVVAAEIVRLYVLAVIIDFDYHTPGFSIHYKQPVRPFSTKKEVEVWQKKPTTLSPKEDTVS